MLRFQQQRPPGGQKVLVELVFWLSGAAVHGAFPIMDGKEAGDMTCGESTPVDNHDART